jgi:3-oxoadipyl-CoA thiolase
MDSLPGRPKKQSILLFIIYYNYFYPMDILDAYVIDAVRTPIGKYGGTLANTRPDDLLAIAIKGLLQRCSTIDLNDIEDVIAGAANQSGEDNRNVARMAALLAGLPTTVAGNTVNRLCASGLQAIMDASRAVMLGEGNMYIACGVESMTRAPFVMPKTDTAFGRNPQVYDTTLGWRFTNPALSALYHPYTMGETAENVANEYNISREDQDEFAYNSQQKYAMANINNKFLDEIIPVTINLGKGKTTVFDTDEHPRATTPEKLAELKPAFAKEGSVTAGNSSGINDGAAALLIANATAVKQYNLKPMAKIIGMAVAGVHPSVMGIGPVPAVRKALKRAGISARDIGLVELNEAFASQALACTRELGFHPDIINVNGGAIALGHPLGASGARISTTLLHEMKKRNVKYGIASMCIGVGQGAAIVYELQ